ncbi:MAG: helix-turn-helix domain-containing protein [Ezakiella coagulans]|uniref:helix-turn-helix domain-containing protein n=1 Tax=Ezakiella coagulans TaxID=46507 RepID=UPI00399AE120
MSNIKSNFKNNIIYYLNLRQKTQSDLAKAIGVAKTTVSSYVNGVSTPRLDKIDKICDFLNIKRSALLESSVDGLYEDKEIMLLARDINNLTEEQRNLILSMIKQFRGE